MKPDKNFARAVAAMQRVYSLYEHIDYRHASGILVTYFATETLEICEALSKFRITEADIRAPGGNESPIPKRVSTLLRPLGWREGKLVAKQVIEDPDGREENVSSETHKIDFVKGQVAFDLEWNSKDQTFDRDLYAFRSFFEYSRISVGILLTRSDELDDYFKSLGDWTDKYGTVREIRQKYGASTTHMGKLRPRLEAGRSGGCPVLALGITRAIIE